MPSAIVTGATGFVGSHLVDLLLERGYRVMAVVRPTSRLRWLEGKAVERIEGDLSRPMALPQCDIFFHVAGVIRANSYIEYLSGNLDAAVHALEGARAGRFVHVSSLAVAGPGEDRDETTPCAPISLYGKSKWEGERAVWDRRDRIPVTVVRPPVVYGPRDFGLYEIYKVLNWRLKPSIGGPKRVSFVHVRDLAEGILRAAEAPEGANEVFYLGNREACELTAFQEEIIRAMGRSWALPVPIPDWMVRFLGAVSEDAGRLIGKRPMFGRDKAREMTQKAWVCRSDKALQRLGWEARTPLPQGLAEAVSWYRAQGML